MMNNDQKNNSALAEFQKIQSEATMRQWETVNGLYRMGNYFPINDVPAPDFCPARGPSPVITDPEHVRPS